jgi:hypothetical protein
MAINNIRLPDGTELKLDEWLHYPIFSTIEYAAFSKVNLLAFTYVTGQNVPTIGLPPRTADDADTNQTVRTRTNQDEALVIYSMTNEFFGLSGADVTPSVSPTAIVNAAALAPTVSRHVQLVLQRDILAELFVGANINKPQLRVPLSRLSQSIGPVIHGTSTAVAAPLGAPDLGTQGEVCSSNQWRLELPIYIESDRVFKVRMSSPAAMLDMNQHIRQRIWLDGMKRRPVA